MCNDDHSTGGSDMQRQPQISIIGAGPAGISAAIYLQRAGYQPLLFEKNIPGGLLHNAYRVENYPGFPEGIPGSKLVDIFLQQLTNVGGSILFLEACHIQQSKHTFVIQTATEKYISDVVIIASGTKPKKINIVGSRKLEGTRLFYDRVSLERNATENKRILVLGGGDASFDYSLSLHAQGHTVSLIMRSEPKALFLLRKRVQNNNIPIYTQHIPQEILFKNNELLLRCRHKNKKCEFFADMILVAYGRKPCLGFLSSELQKNILKKSLLPATPTPGLYLAGDAAQNHCRQVGIAVGDGIHAAMLAGEYLKKKKGCL